MLRRIWRWLEGWAEDLVPIGMLVILLLGLALLIGWAIHQW